MRNIQIYFLFFHPVETSGYILISFYKKKQQQQKSQCTFVCLFFLNNYKIKHTTVRMDNP